MASRPLPGHSTFHIEADKKGQTRENGKPSKRHIDQPDDRLGGDEDRDVEKET